MVLDSGVCMIDLSLLRKNPTKIIALIKKKEPSFDVSRLIELDESIRTLRSSIELLRQKKNDCAQKAKAGLTDVLRNESIAIGKELKAQEKEFESVHATFQELYLSCPNIPLEDVPEGDAICNSVIRMHGEKPHFTFEPQHHLDIGTQLGWFDFEIGAKIAGSNFAFYKAPATRLLYTLSMFMMRNNIKHGFSPVMPPLLVNKETLTVSGNFPKFKDQVYYVQEDDLYLTPTSEVDLVNVYRDTIIPHEELPVRMTAFTSCFRREAGNYGAHERGMIRMHQFEKVELVSLCDPECSLQELDRMIACAEDILQQLGLHYRVSLLAGQDTSFQSQKTYDIEVWLPGQKEYREVSSASLCGDFQARRGSIRYSPQGSEKNKLVHTLNASSLALPRLMVALIETYQQEDGTIALPEPIRNFIF